MNHMLSAAPAVFDGMPANCSSRSESPLMGYYPVSQLHQLTQKVYVQGKAKLQPAIQLRYYFQLLVTT